MRLFAIGFSQVPLQVLAIRNRAALMHELLAEARLQRLDQPAAAIRDEEDPSGERQAATWSLRRRGRTRTGHIPRSRQPSPGW
jgi:hypothetical protein